MKKRFLLMALLVTAFAVSACGKKSSDTTADSQTTVEGEADGSAASEDGADAEESDVEEAYFEGVVTALTKDQMTVTSNDGIAMTFAIDKAEKDADNDLLHGCYVEVAYPAEGGDENPSAISVTVLMTNEQQADEEGTDPMIFGTVKFIDQNDLIIDDINGKERTLDCTIARKVGFSDITEGSEVYVTYIGTIDRDGQMDNEDGSGAGTPIVLKIVAADAVSSEDAKRNCVTGVVNQVVEDQLMLDTEAGTFTFSAADPSIFAGLEGEENVTVDYQGPLGNRSAEATALTRN